MKSRLAFWFSVLILLGTAFWRPTWQAKADQSTFAWDVCGYYWYLPSAFIYHNLRGQHFGDSIIQQYGFTPRFEAGFRTPSGGYVLTYSAGMALLYVPAFAAAHAVAKPLGYPADGFSKPYQAAIAWYSLLVAATGLWAFRRLLRYYYSDGVTAVVLLLLVAGTNYGYYTAIAGALTHNYLFTIYVFLLLATRAFYQTYHRKYAIAIGALCGLAVLVRPTEIVCIILPLLWGMERLSLAAIKERLRILKMQWRNLSLAAACVVVIGAIQLVYWKYVSGSWIVYSYAEKEFSWTHPHFRDYALSYRSGWLTYTPLMALAFIGIPVFLKKGNNKVAVLTFFAVSFYVVSAWDIWWYGGIGGRAMIQSYPVILLPAASFLEWMLCRRRRTALAAPFILIAVYLNIWLTIEAHGGEGLFDSQSMTGPYYRRVAGRWHAPEEAMKLKDADAIFEGRPKALTLLYKNDLEADTTLQSPLPAIEGRRSVYIDKAHPASPVYGFALPARSAGWLRAQATFRTGSKEWSAYYMPQLAVTLYRRGIAVKAERLRPSRFLSDGETRPLFVDVKLPEAGADSAGILFRNAGSDKWIMMDELRVWSFAE